MNIDDILKEAPETPEDEVQDYTGDVLAALNQIAVMGDDLYALVGEDESSISDDDKDAIMNCFDILSEVYDKADAKFDLPSEDEIPDEELSEAYVPVQKVIAALEDYGFSPMDDKEGDDKVKFGIAMRAGKWADSFVTFQPKEKKQFVLDVKGKKTEFADLAAVEAGLKKLTKKESVSLDSILEAVDVKKFQRLARTGLVEPENVQKIVRAFQSLEDGKELTRAQKDLVSQTFLELVGLVTGDSAVFSKIQQSVRNN